MAMDNNNIYNSRTVGVRIGILQTDWEYKTLAIGERKKGMSFPHVVSGNPEVGLFSGFPIGTIGNDIGRFGNGKV